MSILETFKTALKSLRSNKVRSFLTMLGVIIGVFAVVSLVSLGIGLQNYITDQFNSLGSNLLIVAPGKINFADDPAESFTNNKLDEKHIDLIKQHAGDVIEAITPSFRIGRTVEYKNKNYFSTFMGSNAEAEKIFNVPLKNGRKFTENEVKAKARVALVGPLVIEELFPNVDPIGKKIKIGDDSYTIVGVTLEKNQDFDDNVRVPYTALKETLDIENFSGIAMKAYDDVDLDFAIRKVELALARDLDKDEFSVIAPSDILESFNNILGALTAGLGAIAGISLIVGGIGIMNIMLVSVTERTREIGLRKALGATPGNIVFQFLLESTFLSVIGGALGLLLGFVLAFVIQSNSVIRAEIPAWAVLIAFGFSVFVGVLFGTYPALKASRLDPIEALRYE